MLKAFRKTGILPFTRKAHLEANRADVQIGDALMKSEQMEDNRHRREDADVEARGTRRRLEMDDDDVDTGVHVSPTAMPLRVAAINEISMLFGERDNADTMSKAESFGLKMWPRYEVNRTKPTVWSLCLDKSPALRSQLHRVDREALLQMHNVGVLLEEDMDNLSSAQAFILGFVSFTYMFIV